jgi:hypothetical protein
MSADFDANQVFNTLVDQRIKDIHTCIPGQIESFDGIRANVKPLIKKLYVDDEEEELPVISSVPVVFNSSSNMQLTYPLNKGDGCMILFSERGLDKWMDSGRDSAPTDRRKFDLTDAICVPGLWSPATDPKEVDLTSMLLKFGDAKLKFDNLGKMALGNSSAELLDITDQFLDAMISATVIIPGGSSAGTYPLDPATIASLNTIKTLLALIKGTL